MLSQQESCTKERVGVRVSVVYSRCVASAQSTDGTARSAGKPCFSLRRFSFLTLLRNNVSNSKLHRDFTQFCMKFPPLIQIYSNTTSSIHPKASLDHLSIIRRQSFFASPLSCSTQAPQARICCPGWCTVLTARALWRGFAASLSGVNWWEWWVACSLRLILGSHKGWFFMLCWVKYTLKYHSWIYSSYVFINFIIYTYISYLRRSFLEFLDFVHRRQKKDNVSKDLKHLSAVFQILPPFTTKYLRYLP